MKKTRTILRDAVLLLGCALVAVGAGLLSFPAGLIAAGALLMAVAVADGYDNDEGSDGSE